MPELLIVDDERAARFGMKKALSRSNGYNIYEAENGDMAMEIIKDRNIDIVFLDLNMPGRNGMAVLEEIQKLPDSPLVIVVTAHGSEKIAVQSMKKGAYDYIAKPYEVDELRFVAQHALERLSLKRENERLQEEIRLHECFGEIIGQSQAICQIYALIERVTRTDVTVLVCGESGTGKELVAKEIHRRSKRCRAPFIAMNCAALAENLIESELFGHEKGAFTGASEQRKGKLEEADGGTLFLDEIGDMSLSTQAKVLRVLQDRTFERLGGNNSIHADVRFIAATNKDLSQEIEDNHFREDLYYRINVIDINLPPLRQRDSDISLLARRFLELFARKYQINMAGITPQALQKLMNYHWPGNVRQLKNVIEKSVLLAISDQLTVEDLPPEVVAGDQQNPFTNPIISDGLERMSFKDAKKRYVREFEKCFIVERLKAFGGNISQTAQALEMPRQSLQQKLKELEINAREIVND